ncbi:alpha/beta fold hydrolase [Microcoleus sp. FACHB-1515]|uniref:alpha/beta fold hydrolase n=1 Tax=Cyanophyceae TaxID=3028117 RepID=UPI0016876E54|nr:alpha/beta fold hydrolase [Microcoleus sp. FACHB-1515]MBD2092392.1 alpha/beta fold hydrolase [Microcoleus sp. FACHB-1515]
MQQSPQDQYVWVGDVNTRYWRLGTQGSAIVFIHGIGSAIETWALNVEALAQHHQVYALDLVGSGRSDKPLTSYSLVALAEFVKGFADEMGLDRLSLIGNSMGGGIALQFALLYPQQIEKLLLVNSLGLGQEVSWSLRLANLPLVDRFYKPTRSSTALTLKQAVENQALITDEWIDRFHTLLSLSGAPEALIAQIRTNIDWWGVRREVYQPIVDRLSTITAPTLIVWGKQDQILPVAHAQTAMQQLPNASLQLFDPCGHWSHFERAAEFNRLVSEFLTNF